VLAALAAGAVLATQTSLPDGGVAVLTGAGVVGVAVAAILRGALVATRRR
jgi:threonine dehydrogenase-like Zn-dependent dehydrogenase